MWLSAIIVCACDSASDTWLLLQQATSSNIFVRVNTLVCQYSLVTAY